MRANNLWNYLNKILVFYLPGKAGYWNSITHCAISEKPIKLGKYYLDFASKAQYNGKISEDNIPLTSYRGQDFIQHPTIIAQYALGLFELLSKNDFQHQDTKKRFIELAKWFDKNYKEFPGGKCWVVNVLYPELGINSPWISAMTQGEIISVLVRAASISNDSRLEQLAIDALAPFEFDVKDGGVVNYFKSIPVYEEAPIINRTTAVLNGFIFSLFGLFDLLLFNNNSRSKRLFNLGVDSLIKLLPYYDIKYWTRYRLMEYPESYLSSFTYHMLVIEQLKVMYFITGEQIFQEYSDKWYDYTRSYSNRTRALFNKLISSNQILMG
ncbi:MAG: hypothetical protein KGZ85_04955 [Ignavibacterium sp.]|nr:hypothetical protein [Ignavibacterium sp.]